MSASMSIMMPSPKPFGKPSRPTRHVRRRPGKARSAARKARIVPRNARCAARRPRSVRSALQLRLRRTSQQQLGRRSSITFNSCSFITCSIMASAPPTVVSSNVNDGSMAQAAASRRGAARRRRRRKRRARPRGTGCRIRHRRKRFSPRIFFSSRTPFRSASSKSSINSGGSSSSFIESTGSSSNGPIGSVIAIVLVGAPSSG